MPYPKSKSRALLTLAAGASSAFVACGNSNNGPMGFYGTVATIPDSGGDANDALCTATNPCGIIALPDAGLDATFEGCDACGIVALPPDSGPDADDAGDADETSTDAAADADEQ
jgi:hypothetical protein